MRCDACGARNPAKASWCSQCFASFAPTPPAEAPTSGPASDQPAPPVPGRAPRPAAPAPASPPPERAGTASRPDAAPPTGPRERDVRQRDGEVEWRCAVCDGWSPLRAATCRRCGAGRTGFGVDAPEPVAGEELQRLVVLTVLLPGLGHVRAGRVGTGAARAVIAVAWLVGALVLGVGALRTGAAPIAAVPLALGAAIVWVASVRDVRALGDGRGRELLDARGLLWLVAGVTGLLAVVLLLDTMRLTG
jgi:ribosomal protein L40E